MSCAWMTEVLMPISIYVADVHVRKIIKEFQSGVGMDKLFYDFS